MSLLTEPAMAAPLPCNVNSPELPWTDLGSGLWLLPAPWTVVAGPMWTLLAALWGYSLGCSIPVQWGGGCICLERGLAVARSAVTSPGLVLCCCWGCAGPHVLVQFLLLQSRG